MAPQAEKPTDLTRPRYDFYRNKAAILEQLRQLNRYAIASGWTKALLVEQSLIVQRQWQLLMWDAAAHRYQMDRTRRQKKRLAMAKERTADKFSNQATKEAVEQKFDEIEEAKAKQGITERVRPPRIIIP